DVDPRQRHLYTLGLPPTQPHPLADETGVWFRDPDGTAVQMLDAPKASPDTREVSEPRTVPPGKGAAPSRSAAGTVRPRRLSHILLFSSDVLRSARVYSDSLAFRLSAR